MNFAIPARQASLSLTLILALPLSAAWRMSGPFGGSARSLAIDPQNRNTLLAGARDSLLFRSDDAGVSWRLLPFPRGAPGTFNALIIHPTQTGHFYAGLDSGDSEDSGVYQSKDGGQNWKALTGARGSRIESLAMWPSNPRVLAAGTSKGVLFTNDSGETWQRISNADNPEMQDITALAFDPADSKIIYAGTPHLPWKTIDGGATWNSIRSGLIEDSDIFSIHINPNRPQFLLASACSGIYRSDDAGGHWTKLTGIPGTHRRTHIIAADPSGNDTIFAGTTLGLLRSSDAGRTWRQLTFEQVNWLVFDPQDTHTLLLATEHAGIWKTTDSGETFLTVNAGFANHHLSQIAGAGQRLFASSVYAGHYGGVFASVDGGLNWTLRANDQALRGMNLHSLVAAPSGPSLLFAASQDAVVKSVDGGKTWSMLIAQPGAATGSQRPRIHALQAAQTDRLGLWAGTQAGLFHSSNDGVMWQAIKSPGISGVPVLEIYLPPRGASRLAVRTRSELFISDDAGLHWHPAPMPDSTYYIYDIALPVERDSPILAATSRGVLQSVDGGLQWTLITKGVPAATVDAIRFHPERTSEAFLVQYGKLYSSPDAGVSWKLVAGEESQNLPIRSLWFAPQQPSRVFGVSADRGALIFDLPQRDLAAMER